MKQLLNTLFVTSEDIYLSLEGENVLANREKNVVARYPLHTLQTIVSFSYSGASPALMGPAPSGASGWPSARPGAAFWPGPAERAAAMCFSGGSSTALLTMHSAAVKLPGV